MTGKSAYVVRHVIAQHLAKNFCLFVYDFKFPDLSIIAYNHTLKNFDKYEVKPKFCVINFDDLSRSHRCNLISPETMHDITDATESSRSIMLGLNRSWVQKIGDFWVESPINFITALIWFLKKYKGGKYCTLPHVIELGQTKYDELFPTLMMDSDLEVLINPFWSAYENSAFEQLEGQIASAKIGLARLSSPGLYYVLSGNDFTLDLNNPKSPKVVCVGNNPGKTQIYGAVISLCIERMIKLVNRKGQLKSSLIFDEFPTVYAGGIPQLIAVARGNRVCTTIAVQDLSQLRADYGREQAEVIMNVCGNVIAGQVLGDTAKLISDRVGRIMQERESLSINSSETSISKSSQLEAAIPPSRISSLSSGEFVGAVADDPMQQIKYKAFHCRIVNDFDAIQKEEAGYKEIPVIRKVTSDEVNENYYRIKREVKAIIAEELNRIGGRGRPAPRGEQEGDIKPESF